MRLTARQLNRATLGRQLLLGRADVDVVDAVRALCALQAQSPASPYIALWNRVRQFDAADLDRAFVEHRVLKASLLRITLHVVTAEDYPAFHRTMVPSLRAARLHDRRFKSMGLSIDDADALVPPVLEFVAEARTNAELEAMLAERLGALADPGPWWALRTFAPVVHAPTGNRWTFGDRPSYRASPSPPFDGTAEKSLPRLVWRYLEAFGPATEADFCQFTIIRRPAARAAFEVLADRLVTHEDAGGQRLYDVPGGAVPPEDSDAPPRLMAMWDSILLAYQDRSRVIPEAYRKLVIRNNGDTLPTVLVDGHVAGVWRPAPDRAGAIEVTAFHSLDDTAWEGLEAEAHALVAFLADREPDVYRRYARWWTELPAADVRLL